MALQDLTPQLRTRLSRMERAVGWFVALAVALLVFGFAYYVHNTAKRKGWFKARATYYTLVDRATGLRVGDPVTLMGFEAGRITKIEPLPPWDDYNVYVEFEIIEPHYGYLWTKGSYARVASADLLGKRGLEVTKGTNGHPTYLFYPLQTLTLAEAEQLAQPEKWKLAEDVYQIKSELLMPALTPLFSTNVIKLLAAGRKTVLVFDTRQTQKKPTVVWNDWDGRYDYFNRTNLYWLYVLESPAVSERLEQLVGRVESALPNILALTNQLAATLSNTATLTSNLNVLATTAQPAAENLAALSAQLRGPGALGEWALGTNGQGNLVATLETANRTLGNADTNLTQLAENLAVALDNLAGITSNLHAQVNANTNILLEISEAVVHTDQLVQGLKKHWFLRSAFKEKKSAPPAKQK